MPENCRQCRAPTETWWSYCAMCGFHIAGAGALDPGMDWKLSPETEAALKEIDDNQRRAAIAARNIIVG